MKKIILFSIIFILVQQSQAFALFKHTGAFLSGTKTSSYAQYSNTGILGETFVTTISYGGNYTLKTGGIYQMENPGTSKTIDLLPGFQFISLPVEPETNNLTIIFEEILDQLAFIKDLNGKFLRKIGSQWINNIGDWTIENGYLIKMNDNASLTINGNLISTDVSIVLHEGYSIVPYYGQNQTALTAFSPIMDHLEFARDSKGKMLRKIGTTWVDNIGQIQEGDACLLKMNDQSALQFSQTSTRKRISEHDEKVVNTINRHFHPVNGNPADPIWTIYLEDARINDLPLESGDEIAVFDGSLLVGSIGLSEPLSPETRFNHEITVWSTLSDGNGYVPGHNCTIKYWDKSEQKEYSPVDIEMVAFPDSYNHLVFPVNDGQFSVARLSFSQISVELLTAETFHTRSESISVTVLFGKAIQVFSDSDVLISNGNIDHFKQHSDTKYSFNVIPESEGKIDITLSEQFIRSQDDLFIENSLELMHDTSPPSITIKGEATVYLWQGDEYTDRGAIAIDNQDGDITQLIQTDNPVNTHIPGEYKIVYTASDASGNVTISERWVIVEAAKVYHGFIKADQPQAGLPEYMNDVLIYIVNGDQASYSVSTSTFTDNRPTGNGQNGYFSFRLPDYDRPFTFLAVINGYVSKAFNSEDHIDMETFSDVYLQTQVLTYAHRTYIQGHVTINENFPEMPIYIQIKNSSHELSDMTIAQPDGSFFLGMSNAEPFQSLTVTASGNGYYAEKKVEGELPMTGINLNLLPGNAKRINQNDAQSEAKADQDDDSGGSCFVMSLGSSQYFSFILIICIGLPGIVRQLIIHKQS
jgi:hypothetical protein